MKKTVIVAQLVAISFILAHIIKKGADTFDLLALAVICLSAAVNSKEELHHSAE